MNPALPEPAEHALAALRRARACGERFAGALVPGASARRMQAAAAVDEWAAANLDAHHGTGPLWVVLGDGASLGLGASTRAAGYVSLVAEALTADAVGADGAPWRVVNLAHVGADLDDVLTRQLPELAAVTEAAPAALVTCVVGAADVLGRPRDADTRLRALLAALPAGAVVATLPVTRRSRPAAALNATLREEAARRGLRVVDVWDDSGRRGRWFGAQYHPNDVGHAAWARAVLAAVRPTGAEWPGEAPCASETAHD
jgi:lysophospholipase L1-like esterase